MLQRLLLTASDTAELVRWPGRLRPIADKLFMNSETFIKTIAPLLKAHGFKKSNATWRRLQAESIAVLNVTKSPWGSGDYYINLGTYFLALGSLTNPTENKCHVQMRLALAEPVVALDNALSWFAARERLSDASRLADSDSKKGLVFKEVRIST